MRQKTDAIIYAITKEKGVLVMKKLISLVLMTLVVVSAGLVYADDTREGLNNGVTIFSVGPASFDDGTTIYKGLMANEVEGAAAGGVSIRESGNEQGNGVTIFSVGPATFDEIGQVANDSRLVSYENEGSGAGGVTAATSTSTLYNGITIFSSEQ
jgi:hypothetical protein